MPAQTQTASVTLRPTAWADAVTLNQVDPASGVQSITLSVDSTVATSAWVTNFDLAPAMFSSSTTGSVALLRPNGTPWVTAAPMAFLHGSTLPAASGNTAVPVEFYGQGSATAGVGYQAGRDEFP